MKQYKITVSGSMEDLEAFIHTLGCFVNYHYTETGDINVPKVFNKTTWGFDDFEIVLKPEWPKEE